MEITDLIKLKNEYNIFLQTERGKELTKIANDMKMEFQESNKYYGSFYETKNIKLSNFDNFVSNKIHLLKITKIGGLNNMCHINSEFFLESSKKLNLNLSHKFGYNLFSCRCSKMISCELHSVNQYQDKLKKEII